MSSHAICGVCSGRIVAGLVRGMLRLAMNPSSTSSTTISPSGSHCCRLELKFELVVSVGTDAVVAVVEVDEAAAVTAARIGNMGLSLSSADRPDH